MDNNTRAKLFNWIGHLGKAYGVHPRVIEQAKSFVATGQVEQALAKDLKEKSSLLSKINVKSVSQIMGKKLGMNTNQNIASNTDTSGAGERNPNQVFSGMDEDSYICRQTNYDTAITYDQLDEWSEFKNFMKLIQDSINTTIANNKATIGWYGETWVANSNIGTNPMMQDVNIGWFQKIRDNASSQMLPEGGTPGEIRFGAGGDFENLDHAVEELKGGIPSHKQNQAGMVVLVGSDLLSQQRIDLYKAHGATPTEKERVEVTAVTSTFGNLPLATEISFPGRGLMIVPWKNLGIYTQKGSTRRSIKDNSKKDQIENYLSMREAYVVEDYQSVATWEFKNVKLPNAAGDGWE